MMGISSSSENEEEDNVTFSSWDSSSTSSESSAELSPVNKAMESVPSRTTEAKPDMDSITDLRVLFNDSLLKDLSSVSTKDDPGQNVLLKHQVQILRWLSDFNLPPSESVITQDMFCDFLATKGVNREDAVEVFSRFDTEGTGKADAEVVHEGVTQPYEESEDGELTYRTRVLQNCSSLPGFVDVFSKTDSSSVHATKLLQFLLRNRAPAASFRLPMLVGFEDITQLRCGVGNEILTRLEKDMRGSEEVNLLGGDNAGDVKSTGKPYSSIEVSSNTNDVHKLTDGNTGSYWQSDGAARSHFIRFNMKKNVVVKQLFIYVNSSDQSYQPQDLVVSVGRPSSLKEIKELKIPSSVSGPFLVVENLKVYYPVVQVNIRRCHSDGCDTRVRLIKITGLRVVKDAEMSVRDASVRWFFQLVTSTALQCARSFPSYKLLVIQQAKEAFRYIPPMSLCHGSPDKPKFLTEPILKEVESFLDEITRDGTEADDGILCKIMYGLASCDLSIIVSVISHLLDNPEQTISAGPLLTAMHTVKVKYWSKGERLLPLTYVDCDGGEKQLEGSSCVYPKDLLFYDHTSASENAYKTKKGKTKFTLIAEASECMQVTRIKIRPDKGGKGVKCGIVFLLPASEVISPKRCSEEKTDALCPSKSKSMLSAEDQKSLYKRLEKYDEWSDTDYEEYKKQEVNSDGVLTYFNTPEDPNEWDEFDITIPERNKLVGRIIVIKFLKPRSEQSDTIGVIGVNLFGYTKMSEFLAEIDTPPTTDPVTSAEFAGSILSFLVAIIKSLENRQTSGFKMSCVDFSRLTVSLVTTLFERAERLGEPITMKKVLRLCHCIFLNWAPGKDEKDSSLLFDTFSSFINSPNDFDLSVVAIAKAVIVDGAKAFFPNDETRREQLLRMLKDINRADELASTSLVFESLCQFFSNVEPSALLNLPHPSECLKSPDILQTIDTSCFNVLDTLIHVTLHKALTMASQANSPPKNSSSTLSTISSGVAHSVLVKLLSCLQTSFLAWINAMRNSKKDDLISKSRSLLISYMSMSISQFVKFTDTFIELPDRQLSAILGGQEEFVFSTIQQLVVFLSEYCKSNNSPAHNVEMLKALWPFVERMKILRNRLPSYFLPLDSSHWTKVQAGMEVLNTWTEESPHNYANNQNLTKTFNCPGAKLFILEFDPRCHTERKYDYLEFTNFSGIVHKYDQKTGTEAWPLRVEMKGSKLQFTFHSDQSNNEWGYKFTVTAKGVPDALISPLFDLHLSMALLVGQVCGQTISMQETVTKSAPSTAEEENKQAMLRSNLWKTLFRAGYQPTDRLERSLSGRYMHGCFDNVKGYLLELLNDPSSEPYSNLLSLLRSRCKHYKDVGTDEISSAILYTFAVLVYHTSDICESLSDYITNARDESLLIEGVFQAYNIAEQLRLPLIMLRQKTIEKGEAEDFTLAKEMVDKANLLLMFAALTKAPHLDKCMKSTKPRKTSARIASSHDLLKRLEGSIPERYGQFRLVLEFIVEPSWNCQMVENVIQERVKKSKSLNTAYQLICDYLTSSSHEASMLQLDVVLFLRAVLNTPKSFPSHYADAIDGCGLEQESKLRQRFYSLIRLLVKFVNSFPDKDHSSNIDSAALVIQTCLLHLLAVDWRENDLMFIKEINLPKLLFDASKDNVAVRERITHPTDEKEELNTYDRDKTYYSECYDSFSKWYTRNSASHSKNKDVQMFIARHCDLLDVEIYCDGCKQTMPGRRYRCLECIDMDLCVTCFTGGVNPGGDHNGNHSFVYFMYKCDICKAFISGERVHCKACDDFDLCYGCHKTKKSQPGHDADHDVIKYPQTRLKSSCDSNKLASYIHQHAWLQFSQLTLAMAGTVFEQSEARASEDYTDTAGHLLTQCLSLITDCLQKVSAAPTKELPTNYREEVFVQHSQERIMGLLGAIISLDEQYDAELNSMLTAIDFLKFIFYIASGHGGYGHQSTVQHLALGLLSQLMQKSTISTQATDEAVLRTQKRSVDELEDQESGIATIEFLVHAASTCLQRQQGIDWSYSLIRLLQQLIHTEHWSAVMKKYLTQSVTAMLGTMSLHLVLCLFIITDFPQVKSPGVSVTYLDYASDEKKAVILKHFPDRMQSMLIDTVTRKRKMVKDQLIDKYSSCPSFYDEEIIALITKLILDNSAKLMKGAWLDVEAHWVLSLCLKAFDQFVTRLVPYENLEVIRSLVNLAGMGTRLSKLWLVSDLEILSLMLYIKLHNDTAAGATKSTKSPGKSSLGMELASKPSVEDSSQLFPDMDSDSRKHFMVLLEMLNIPATQLKQVYHDHRESPSLLLQALQGLFLDDSSEKSKRSPSKPPTGKKEADLGEVMIDFGILPNASLPSPPAECIETLETAEEEKADTKNTKKSNSFPSSGNAASEMQRSTSAKLLKSELADLLQKSPSQVHLNKVNLGLSILYARQALGTILANWSVSGPRISAELLNCEQHNLALVLDVLNRDATNLKQFEKVVAKVMSCCKEDYLQSVADSASYFMEEKKTVSAVRESPHQKSKSVKGTVNIKGASVLSVTFDKCCHTSTESSLDLATTADMKKNHHKFHGPKEKWKDFEVPSDTLYFEYHPAASGPSKWRFTVKKAVNSSSGSFFTGFVILNHILSTPLYCRIIDSRTLWKRLVVVACKQTGDQRLKAIQLLLYLLQSHIKCNDQKSFDGPTELKMDLRYLAPLWKLYKSLSEDHGPEQTSAVLRALTELFFTAENVAMQWNVTGEFMSCMIDPSALQSSLLHGIRRVMALSSAVGYDTGFTAIEA